MLKQSIRLSVTAAKINQAAINLFLFQHSGHAFNETNRILIKYFDAESDE